MSSAPAVARVTQAFSAAPERVYDAWLTSALVGQWMFGAAAGRNEEVVNIAIDARIGGAFSFVVRRDGKELDHFGMYLELDRPRRLVFTWAACLKSDPHDKVDSSRVIIEIVPRGAGSELTLSHEMHPDWAHFADKAAGSWRKMLDRLAASLAN